jgi:condensin-2 complex subunit G2
MQDLMQCLVHANHSGLKAMSPFGKIREIVGEWHSKKKIKGVDEMLCRLYEPILWRSLNVANAVVRRNSLVILADIFPIQNPEDCVDENEDLLKRQFQVLSVSLLLIHKNYIRKLLLLSVF